MLVAATNLADVMTRDQTIANLAAFITERRARIAVTSAYTVCVIDDAIVQVIATEQPAITQSIRDAAWAAVGGRNVACPPPKKSSVGLIIGIVGTVIVAGGITTLIVTSRRRRQHALAA